MTELGKKLKEAREAKGLSLDDLQELTKIQKRYLQGIEEGNYSMMPGKFYVRAFIKQYAEVVGLELNELFTDYKEDIPSVHEEKLPEQISRAQTKKTIKVGNSKFLELFPKILIGIFIIGSIALVYYFIYTREIGDDNKQNLVDDNQPVKIEDQKGLDDKPDKDEKDKQQSIDENEKSESEVDKETDEESDEEIDKNESQEISVVSAKGRNTTFELKNADQFELKIVTTGETWIDIRNGKGTSFYRGMMKVGGESESKTVDFSKETEAYIVVGRTVDTDIFVNGQKIEYAVPPADQVRQDITIRYVKTNE